MSDPEIYGVIVEFINQGPILMETEGPFSSREAAEDRVSKMSRVLRYAVVRLDYVAGNELLLFDMERMQPRETKLPF